MSATNMALTCEGLGRNAQFTDDQIMDTTVDLIARDGPERVTISGIAADVGAPTGSIYYRFATRDLLMARTWIRTVRRSQAGFLEALSDPDPYTAAVGGALRLVRSCRENLTEAQLLLLYRREDLAAQWPSELGDELAGLNEPITRAMRSLVRRLPAATTAAAATFAVIDVPYAAVRRFLIAGRPPPRSVDALVRSTCECVLFGSHPPPG